MKKFLVIMSLIFVLICFGTVAAEDAPTQAPILIQGAMDVETTAMMEALEDAERITIGGYIFVSGKLDGYPVIISKTQVGMVNAAASTAIAIMNFNPLCIINQGTAGGHDPALHAGDIVLGETIVPINAYKSDHLDEGMGTKPETWHRMTFEMTVDDEWGELESLQSDPELLALADSVKDTYTNGNVVNGTIGSGDAWNKEIDRIKQIHEVFNTSAEEMETFATAQVCHQFDVAFLGIRVLSNSELHMENFDPATAINCQHYVLEVAKAIIAEQTK